ncbi:hypothetical protein [Streptomyces sp. NPDC093225]|uniref:helix-turn-helix domain-containing protein n=1 Tax=Streptomyces sp. NPDC093225 TaxID=3366034 RepID=UPI0038077DEE
MGLARRAFVVALREIFFDRMKEHGRTFRELKKETGFGQATLSRIVNGEKLPNRDERDVLLRALERAEGRPLTWQVHEHLRELFHRAWEEKDPERSVLYRFKDEQAEIEERLRAAREATARALTQGPSETADAADTALAVRNEAADLVRRIAEAGVMLPPTPPPPPGPSSGRQTTAQTALAQADQLLRYADQALERQIALAESTDDQFEDFQYPTAESPPSYDAPPPPPSPAAPAQPHVDTPPPAPSPGQEGRRPEAGTLGPAGIVAVVLCVVLLAYFAVDRLNSKDDAAGHNPSASHDPSSGGEPASPTTTRSPQDDPEGLRPTFDPRPDPTSPATGTPQRHPSDDGNTESITPTTPETSKISQPPTGPLLGGTGVSVQPRSGQVDCTQPIVFTFSAAALAAGTVEYRWLPDDRLLAQGITARSGSMTFTVPNEQHEEYEVRLSNARPGDRIQGQMVVEVTSPEADRGTNGDAFDLDCVVPGEPG